MTIPPPYFLVPLFILTIANICQDTGLTSGKHHESAANLIAREYKKQIFLRNIAFSSCTKLRQHTFILHTNKYFNSKNEADYENIIL